jgi:phosphotransferase system HPr (HPr) family protein
VIGIVVVSHSPALADAAVALALDMAGGTPPRIAVAAGAGDGVLGTDAVAVAAAIDEVAGPDGVLVFMDLGSAVLSAGMALEFTTTDAPVRLSSAPFVEGVVAGIVLAAAGTSLDEADREAAGAMTAKNAQLSGPGAAPAAASGGDAVEVTLVNPLGLHARPAAAIVAALAEVDATITVSTGSGPGVSAKSLMGLMSLNAQKGAVLRLEASGADAAVAVETIRAMAESGFGEV